MIKRDFTDIYGAVHTQTKIQLHRGAKQVNSETVVDYEGGEVEKDSTSTSSIYYQMCYWINDKAETDKRECFIYKQLEDEEIKKGWRFEVTADYEGLSIRKACEKHFSEVVMPV